MKLKLKKCAECEQLKPIWKNHLSNKYCKFCWYKLNKKPINKISKKRKIENKEYLKVREIYLNKNSLCQANLPNCTNKATEIHHKEGRQSNYLNIPTWVAICRNCHNYIHSNPKIARKLNLLK